MIELYFRLVQKGLKEFDSISDPSIKEAVRQKLDEVGYFNQEPQNPEEFM